MWHQRKFIRPAQDPPGDGTSFAAVSGRALAFAMNDIPAQVYAEAERLDEGQLARLARASRLVAQAAQDTLNGRF